MSRTVRNWCDICRDLQPDISCTSDGCGKKFHEDCLRNAGYWKPDDNRHEYVCVECQESISNEGFCYICRKELHLVSSKKRRKRQNQDTSPPGKKRQSTPQEEEEDDEECLIEPDSRPRRSARAAAIKAAKVVSEPDTEVEKGRLRKSDMTDKENFVLCDGCSNSAHLSCLGLESLPQDTEEDLWFCTDCDPNSATAALVAKAEAEKRAAALKTSNANAGRNKLGGNVDICYVCQKSGKLLGCDFCEQSFHPRCIDSDFLEFEANAEDTIGDDKPEAEKWRCPICRGEDPLKNMAHKRLSRTAMMKLSREWQDCIKTAHRQCRQNRDKFLWSCRDALLPFATQRTLNRLKKQFAPNSTWPQKAVKKRRRSEEDETVVSRQQEEIEAVRSFRIAERKAKKAKETFVNKGVLLKSYQIIGVGWLLNAFHQKAGAILADEMGLGKTIQCLTFLSALKAMKITGPHLIVVPLSTVGNWAREIRKFVPHLRFVKICGSRFEREHTMMDPTAHQGLYDLYITTYETVVTEESFFCDNFSWQCVILDEAHRIKNEAGRIRHSLDRVAANMRVLLTGTPLQNNVKELFTLLNFLFPDVLRDSDAFQRVFSTKPVAADEMEDEVLDESALNAVTHLLGKMMLRRTKDLVVRLPRKFEHDIWLPLSPLGAEWYRKLLDVSETAVQQQSVKKLLGTVVKMRICCCHPRGLVTRDAQLKRFKEVFAAIEFEDQIEAQATQLIELEGEEHIKASSKLMVLDKLLTQLHVQNLKVSESYTRDFVQNVKDLFVQAHPPAPIAAPPIQRSPAKKSKVKAEDDASVEGKSDVKGLSTRQLAERARRERAAQSALQQAELEAELDRIGLEAVERLKPTAENSELFSDFMVPATIPDVPLPELPDADLDFSESEPEEEENTGVMGDSNEPASAEVKATDDGEGDSQIEEQPTTTGDESRRQSTTGGDDPETPKANKGQTLEETTAEEPTIEEPEEVSVTAAKKVPHKVLVFTQFQLVLDELEKYCQYRGFKYLRLDGSTNKMIRELDIREFNSPLSTHLVYLICTRAGGVGINLVTANHVVLYDEDWNPFIDLQAIDRAHRIGQKRDVHVWKLITEWTVEERMAFRRMQKLKLDRLLIQANAETAEEEEKADEIEEKFSVEEIRRLIRHGRTAIMKATDGESLADKPLEVCIARERKVLPVLEEPVEADEDAHLSEEENTERRVSLIEALEPEDREICTAGIAVDTRTVSTGTDDMDTTEEVEGLEETAAERRASRRLRRRQPMLYQPVTAEPIRVKVERKIIHEKKCFRCGSGVNPADETADPLVPCHRCPKVYHREGCLGFEEFPKKTWTCPWHECCLCFRKGSQAGGLLIHCAECPTTFCFDCFPPEYRRYTPPATYYADLTKRGYPMTADKLVLFLCSRCKALKEQARRRLLSKQQLDLEAKRRREANLKARADAQKAKQVGDQQKDFDKKSLDAKKEFQVRKKIIDDEDRRIVKEIRAAFERLFPPEYLEATKQKRLVQAEVKMTRLPGAGEESPLVEPSQTSDVTSEIPAQPEVITPTASVDKTGLKSMKPPVIKLPGECLKLCENCHLPAHESAMCPFPAETEKRNLASEPTEEERMRGGICKRQIRSFCSKCGVSSRNHFRKHCDQLSTEESEEYESRKIKIKQFIEQMTLSPLVDGAARPSSNPEQYRKNLTRMADEVIIKCLQASGLTTCCARLQHQFSAQRLQKRRRRRGEDGDGADTGGDTDDPSYSPRKKSRLDDEPASDVDGYEDHRATARRRRTRPNFRELDGSDYMDEPRAMSPLAVFRPQPPRISPTTAPVFAPSAFLGPQRGGDSRLPPSHWHHAPGPMAPSGPRMPFAPQQWGVFGPMVQRPPLGFMPAMPWPLYPPPSEAWRQFQQRPPRPPTQ